jgi:hypothetical protein
MCIYILMAPVPVTFTDSSPFSTLISKKSNPLPTCIKLNLNSNQRKFTVWKLPRTNSVFRFHHITNPYFAHPLTSSKHTFQMSRYSIHLYTEYPIRPPSPSGVTLTHRNVLDERRYQLSPRLHSIGVRCVPKYLNHVQDSPSLPCERLMRQCGPANGGTAQKPKPTPPAQPKN